MLRVLCSEQVQKLISMRTAIEINAEAFTALACDEARIPNRIILPLQEHDGFTLFKPGHVSQGRGLGLKVVSIRPGNAAKGMPTVPATIMLFDEVTGMPECVMDATYLTALRTAAGSGIATRLLAPPTASTVVVFGAGMQAEQHVHAMCCVRPISHVTIVNRSRERADRLVVKLSSGLAKVCNSIHEDGAQSVPSFNVIASSEENGHLKTKEAVEDADIVVLATNSSTPLFDGAWLRPGAHINGVGSYTSTMQEVDEATVQRSRVVVDTLEATVAGDLHIPLSNGTITKEGWILKELGPLIVEGRPLAEPAFGQDVTFFKSAGTAVQDLCTAAAVLKLAKERDIGTKADL